MAEQRTILGFYQDYSTTGDVLRKMKREHFRRLATISKTEDGQIEINNPRFSARWFRRALLSGGLVGMLLGLLARSLAPSLNIRFDWMDIVLLAIIGALAGFLGIRFLALGVDERHLSEYRSWIAPKETLLIVQTTVSDLDRALDLLREEQSNSFIFVMRPFRTLDPDSKGTILRRESVSAERLNLYATRLAAQHQALPGFARERPLLRRLSDSERILKAVYQSLREANQTRRSVALSAEWLLDNAYIIEMQISHVTRNLTRRFYKVLPVLTSGPNMGAPRIYNLALELVTHTDGQVDERNITDFLRAYQRVSPLMLGELWAMPLMLRLGLLENLRQLAVQVYQRHFERERAAFWANRLIVAARRDPDQLLVFLAEMARQQGAPSPHFAVQLVRQLSEEESALGPTQGWLERKLGAPLSEIVQHEQGHRADQQVSISNTIDSMRRLSRMDWRKLFEEVSLVEEVLRSEQAAIYGRMDFTTRDAYRHAVEEIARGAQTSEIEVAQRAVTMAQAAFSEHAHKEGDEIASQCHVGHYLIGSIREDFEKKLGCRLSFPRRLTRWTRRYPTRIYLGSIALFTVLYLAGPLVLLISLESSWKISTLLALLALLPASELAVHVVNYLVTLVLPAEPLPKMNFEESIPHRCRTLVVVPMMLLSRSAIETEVERLEVRYLANSNENILFALLSDFSDAPEPHMPEDGELLATAVTGIQRLNERYGSNRFLLFHRPRQWSQHEKCWMGWERKRGKLEELNHFLCGEPNRSGDLVYAGNREVLEGIRFVITLDADTQLPHDSARRLIETLAHPLNHSRPAPDGQTIAQGYTVIQPRVSATLTSTTATRFTRLFAEPAGVDPYTQAVADVYQDLFGEGSYLGKGIYDLRTFHQVLSGRFPESTLLSHDLLEGAYVRVGMASDIELFDLFPANYLVNSNRQHRWIRGDWQIIDWILPWVPVPEQSGATQQIVRRRRNPLSALNRWKIFDNLRRSLIPVASIFLLWSSWLLFPLSAPIWSAMVIVVLLAPFVIQLFDKSRVAIRWLLSDPQRTAITWRELIRPLGASGLRSLASIALLPHQAQVSLDAIVRVWYRRLVSRRQRLEWETAQMTHSRSRHRQRRFLLQITWIALLSVAVSAALLRTHPPPAWTAAAPFLLLWLASPLLIRWLDAGERLRLDEALSPADHDLLRKYARQTWRYFDDFVGPQTHWLPPDNYQESLRIEVAQRTSPTNIGLWLLSLAAAHDLRYVTIDAVLEKTSVTLETLEKLERYEGHLLNWYDIPTLAPLIPRYVSTVDSGNLLASFWTLEAAFHDMLEEPLLGPEILRGLADTFAILREQSTEIRASKLEFREIRQANGQKDGGLRNPIDAQASESEPRNPELETAFQTLSLLLSDPPQRLQVIIQRIRSAAKPAREISEILRRTVAEQKVGNGDKFESPAPNPGYWAEQLERQVTAWLEVIDRYLLWVEVLASPSDQLLGVLDAQAAQWRREALEAKPSVVALASEEISQLSLFIGLRSDAAKRNLSPELRGWLEELYSAVSRSKRSAAQTVAQSESMLERFRTLGEAINMRFLYDADRKLFTVGYNVSEHRQDTSYYDLLASEARLSSFTAVARGDVPVEHWWSMGRLFGTTNGQPTLLSWGGTMFEYLMPLLFTRSYENSLLDQACKVALTRQMEYARQRGIPWGISEAAFAALDSHRIYQYRGFGVPGLGLKRSLEEDIVVAPYATALGLLVSPAAAVKNLKSLAQLGLLGNYGFYEAIDYSHQRVPEGERGVVVRAYMVHHQGMSLLAFDNVLCGQIMQNRFHSDPRVRAAEALLCERIPLMPPRLEGTGSEAPSRRLAPIAPALTIDRFHSPDMPVPRVHLLSNGGYAVMVTSAGGGYSRWRDIDITRWRADTTRDNWGSFLYVRDVELGVSWSATHQPFCRVARRSSVVFTAERAEFRRRDFDIDTVTEVLVSPEDDAEIRRITLTNHSNRTRELELTSYVELALAPHNADRSHPAFSKMFVITEAVLERGALLAHRRPRNLGDPTVWAAHLIALPFPGEEIQYETDRIRFLGRNRTPQDPVGLEQELSNSAGAVLDPIFSLRWRFSIRPGQRVPVSFITVATETREAILALAEKYCDLRATQRAMELAWTHAQLELRQLRISPEDGRLFQQLAGNLLYPNSQLRPPAERLRQNILGQERLWAYGISGDLPILLASISDTQDIDMIRQLLLAHNYLRARGLKADLLVINEETGGYMQPLMEQLRKVIQAHSQFTGIDQPGGVFLRTAEQIPEPDLTLLLATARAVLVAARGTLAQQLGAPVETFKQPPPFLVTQRVYEEPSPPLPFMELPHFNGLGGFTPEGKEYAIYLGPSDHTPMPWINVIANPNFGTLVGDSGPGFCWYGNSQSNRLTPWSNDPVSNPSCEAIYIRDEETGSFWTPAPLPIREMDAYRVRHGQGYTRFEHNSHAIEQELLILVPLDENDGAPVRIQRLKLKNSSSRRRRLAITSFAEWVLGADREDTQLHVTTNWDAESRSLLARNRYSPDFSNCVAFAACYPEPGSFTADRSEFLGRNGSAARPAALERRYLSGRAGAGMDPCAALQVNVEIEPGQETEIVFLLGQAEGTAAARALAQRFQDPSNVEKALKETQDRWDQLLGTIQVDTPNLATNFLLNRWLLYQTLSCRIWGRSGFYQPSGAFGFRDQLQDVLSLLYAAPDIAREQIIRAAARQFVEGDVQHWWNPQSGAGVRTRISDDLLWLPYVTAHYVKVTSDRKILDLVIPFLEGRLLEEHEHEVYMTPSRSIHEASLLEHCRRAIEKSFTSGPHGLPLMGTGDWNDGMNNIGSGGKGESVWLAWFLIDVLKEFANVLCFHGDEAKARDYRERAAQLARVVESVAWDGQWYRRAYFDDGTPVGSQQNSEAKIDSLTQSWAVISDAADPQRAGQALQSVQKMLIREADKMVLLFTPPFDKAPENPGYIKSYPPGVRENGGQYTHGALWVAQAFARRGDGNEAVKLLYMMNPVEHARTSEEAERYKVEPYVMAADIYSLEGRVGQGGWTWYTGSSGWMYRIWIEEILGFKLRGNVVRIDPCMQSDWEGYTLHYRRGHGWYHFHVENPEHVCRGVVRVEIDGQQLPGPEITLNSDPGEHSVRVVIGKSSAGAT